MPTAEARIPTDRADRYLVQLRGHLDHMSAMRHRSPAGRGGGRRHEDGRRPSKIEHVDDGDGYGIVRFAEGWCTFEATSDALIVCVRTSDEDTLRRVQNGLAERIEKMGRRDRLAVTWSRSLAPEDAPGEPSRPASAPDAVGGERHR